MTGEATARPGGDRMFTAYVTVSDGGEGARGAPPGRRWRAVCGALLVSVALIAAAAGLRARSASDELASGAPLGSAAQAEQMGELSALASEAIANARPTFVRGQKLAWLNAGAVPDDNVFDHPVTWNAPDDPARTQAKKGTAEYVTSVHPAGGLEVDHETDNGSPKGDSFGSFDMVTSDHPDIDLVLLSSLDFLIILFDDLSVLDQLNRFNDCVVSDWVIKTKC